MNKTLRKVSIWYVRREIKKYDKKYKVKKNSDRFGFGPKESKRIEKLLKWEYSLKTEKAFGEDATMWKHRPSEWAPEPTIQQSAQWDTDNKTYQADNTIEKPDHSKKSNEGNEFHYWTKTVDGVGLTLTDESYQKMRKERGLPPREWTMDVTKNFEYEKQEREILGYEEREEA